MKKRSGNVKGWTRYVEGGPTIDPIPTQGMWKAETGRIIVDWEGGRTETITPEALDSTLPASWVSMPDECGACVQG